MLHREDRAYHRQKWLEAASSDNSYHVRASSASVAVIPATSLDAEPCKTEASEAPEAAAHFVVRSVQLFGCSFSGLVLIKPKRRNVSSTREKPLYLHNFISWRLRRDRSVATHRKVPLNRSFSPSTSPKPYFSA